jgi:hypothetical protein
MTREEIFEINPEAIIYDGLDDAIVGMAERINLGPVVAYDIEKAIDILKSQMDIPTIDLYGDITDGRSIEDIKYKI